MNIAFIPVRGGSKSIPLKNIKPFAGKPLVYWTVKAAAECPDIDCVFVSTDNEKIRDIVFNFGFEKVRIVDRSEESATDTASTEIVMIEFSKKHKFDTMVLIQATSPLLTSEDITNGLLTMKTADSVLSVVKQKRFLWRQAEFASPINYDYRMRPRRQDFDGILVENGAFYIIRREDLLRTHCRLFGHIKTVEMAEDSCFEIDEPTDWFIAERLLGLRLAKKTKCNGIKMFLTDCDGTLTDGGMYYTSSGDSMKKFHTRDGVGLRLLKEHGIVTGIITGENSEIAKRRGEKLDVDEIMLGVQDKVKVASELCVKYQCNLSEVAYVGDDINDLEILKAVGFSICPADAMAEVKLVANYVTNCSGGEGAIREAADYICFHDKKDSNKNINIDKLS